MEIVIPPEDDKNGLGRRGRWLYVLSPCCGSKYVYTLLLDWCRTTSSVCEDCLCPIYTETRYDPDWPTRWFRPRFMLMTGREEGLAVWLNMYFGFDVDDVEVRLWL